MSDDAPETPPPAGGKKPILLIAAVLVGLGTGGAAGALVVGPKLTAAVAPAPVERALHAKKAATGDEEEDAEGGDHEDEGEEGEGEGDAAGAKGEGKEGEGGATVQVIDNLVLNPAGSGGTRFLLVTVAFDMKNAALAEQVKTRDAEVRDAILNALGGKTVEQLTDPAAREVIKEELKAVVATIVKKKKAVRRIYFPQFVIQ